MMSRSNIATDGDIRDEQIKLNQYRTIMVSVAIPTKMYRMVKH